MKTLVTSIFALSLLGAGVANATGVGAGAHIGPISVGVHAGSDRHREGQRYRHHQVRRCMAWGWVTMAG